MSNLRKTKDCGILWSHNKKKYPGWLDCWDAQPPAIKRKGTWWDVRWQVDFTQCTFPITGYLWNTVEKQVTHMATIGKESKKVSQPEKRLANEVAKYLSELEVPGNENSPLSEYLRGERKTLTLLSLTNLEKLEDPMKLKAFRFCDGRPVLRPPQGYYRIELP